MGVKGLSKFIDGDPGLSNAYELHNTRVVIDGPNIVHYLHKTVDCTLGGNYDEYADKVKDYFSSFIECDISPIVIFDGEKEDSDRKFVKLVERQENRLMKVKSLIENYKIPDSLLPIIARAVFKEVLTELGISIAQCDYEGDNQMAALANHYKCPVISNDSDFYIFELEYGFVNLPDIDKNVKIRTDENGSVLKYLGCKIYYRNKLLEHYPLADKNILYLIAVLAGNDDVPYENLQSFYSKMKVRNNEKFTKLFFWLRSYNLGRALREVLKSYEISEISKIETLIRSAIENYVLKPKDLCGILESLQLPTEPKLVSNSTIETCCGGFLPERFVKEFFRSRMPAFLLSILNSHRNLLRPQVENFANESSHVCSRYIRQVIYGIILQHETKQSVTHKIKCLRHIEEYDRVNDDLHKINVKFLIQLKGGQLVPKLADVYNMGKIQLQKFITDVLGIEERFFAGISTNLQLIFGCIIFWLRNCSPRPTKQFLNALLLCIIYCQIKGTATQQTIVESIKKYCTNGGLQKSTPPPYNPLDLQIVHSYSQLQSCVFYVGTLNSLLYFPFDSPKLHKILSGTLIHNLTEELMFSSNTEVLVKNLLCNDAESIDDFDALKFKIIENIPENYF